MASNASPPRIDPQAARVLADQARYLLDDEVRYADSLKSTRRSLGALLLALVGLGLVKIDLFSSPEESLAVAPWGLWVIRIVSISVVVCFIISFYWLYTERPALFRRLSQRKRERQPPSTPLQRDHGKGAALSVLDLDNAWRRRLEPEDESFVLAVNARLLAKAYERLSGANRRVRYRIEVGKRWLFFGFLLLLIGLGLYTWAITGFSGAP